MIIIHYNARLSFATGSVPSVPLATDRWVWRRPESWPLAVDALKWD